MTTETLTCHKCNSSFVRAVQRGRKPRHCPSCESADKQVMTPTTSSIAAMCQYGFHRTCQRMVADGTYAGCACCDKHGDNDVSS